MLESSMKEQLKAYLVNIREPIELVASLDDSAKSAELPNCSTRSPPVRQGERIPNRDGSAQALLPDPPYGTDIGVSFAGIPLGHEFTSLVLALLQVGGHPSKAAQELLDQVRTLDGDYVFETYFSLSCQNCPDVVQALNLMAVLNPRISHGDRRRAVQGRG
jgi:alkyl hydroperoxide reductase subunit F